MKKLLIAIGHKARHGKDYLAKKMAECLPDNIKIIHWADSLKEEISPKNFPLIIKNEITKKWELFDKIENKQPIYNYYDLTDPNMDLLSQIFNKRNIHSFYGTLEKDRELLQFWGTDYRRNLCNKNYWINKLDQILSTIKEDIIIIPDTRFKNEVEYIKNPNLKFIGFYIDLLRLDNQYNLFYSPTVDNIHASEIDLDNYPNVDFRVAIVSKDFDYLNKTAIYLFNYIYKIYKEKFYDNINVTNKNYEPKF